MNHSISVRYSWLNLVIILAVVAIVSIGCETTAPTYTEVQNRTLEAGDSIPNATGDVVFAVSGTAIGPASLDVDVNILESLGTVKYSVDDPYENREIEYEGVLLENLFDQFGGENSTSVTITAIDDYQQSIPLEDAKKWPILLALKADGTYAPRDERGPSMIVYPYNQYSELEPTEYDGFWVWQIKSMDFS